MVPSFEEKNKRGQMVAVIYTEGRRDDMYRHAIREPHEHHGREGSLESNDMKEMD